MVVLVIIENAQSTRLPHVILGCPLKLKPQHLSNYMLYMKHININNFDSYY